MTMKIFVDCTSIVSSELNTGIQRVERNLIDALVRHAKNSDLELVPVVCFDGFRQIDWATFMCKGSVAALGYLYGVSVRAKELNRFRRLAEAVFPDESFRQWLRANWKGRKKPLLAAVLGPIVYPVSLIARWFKLDKKSHWYHRPARGDVVFVPGSSWWDFDDFTARLGMARHDGAIICVLIHDLFPIMYPEWFELQHVDRFRSALTRLVSVADVFIGNSKSTSSDVSRYLEGTQDPLKARVGHIYLGIDHAYKEPDSQVRPDLMMLFAKESPVFICVGTVEPRKNYNFVLDAFDAIWHKEGAARLCIIGKKGWKADDVVDRIEGHLRLGKSLFWFADLDDAELEYCYRNAEAVIAASLAEGFGLPLIESLREGKALFASDIPVFREIGGDHCHYFSLSDSRTLVSLLERALEGKGGAGDPGKTEEFSWCSWQDSANDLVRLIENVDAGET